MKTLHVMLRVEDLESSVLFYSTLFDTPPSLAKADYAKWLLEDPPVNFTIAPGGPRTGLEHLGIQAETAEELAELRARFARLDGPVEDEGEVVCCYHRSDKLWVTDAQGVSWEAFHTSGESETFFAADPRGGAGTCCPDESEDEPCCAPSCCEDETAAGIGEGVRQ